MSRPESNDAFLYFAYGSNMLSSRILLRNKSAVYRSSARLTDYKFRFGHQSKRWHGHVASIVQCHGAEVWGVLWELKLEDLENLDQQESVAQNIYKRIEVTVQTKNGESRRCYTYQLTRNDELDTAPSPQYKEVIVRGAIEHDLPENYIAWLQSLPDNSYTGKVDICEQL